MEKLGES